MAQHGGTRLVAVYDSEQAARSAAEAARRAGAPDDEVRVGGADDHVIALEAEMREETEHSFMGPGNIGPFTKEMTKAMIPAAVLGGFVGAVLALPFAAIDFGGFALWTRILTVVVCGAVVGGTAGWVIGGGFGARRPGERLAAERGVTVTAPATRSIERALVAAAPIRLDLVEDDQPARTLATEEPRTSGTAREVGRHMRDEPRDS